MMPRSHVYILIYFHLLYTFLSTYELAGNLNIPVLTNLSTSETGDMEFTITNLTQDSHYHVTLDKNKRIYNLCSMDSFNLQVITCLYKSDTPRYVLNRNITITIQVSSTRNHRVAPQEVKYNYNLVYFIRPKPVEKVQLWNVTSHEALIQIKIPQSSSHYLTSSNHLIYYRIVLKKYQGSLYTLKFNISQCDEETESITVSLHNLTSFTNYFLSVTPVGGGGKGNVTSFNFTTNQSVPAMSPRIEGFSFSRFKNSEYQDCVFILWEVIAQDVSGGQNLTYLVDWQYNKTTTTATRLMTCPVTMGNMTVTIWAMNEVGQSLLKSQLFIPEFSNWTKPTVYIELNGDVATMYVHSTTLHDIEKVAIHWCPDTLEDVCTVYPQTHIYNAHYNKEYLEFAVPLKLPRSRTSSSHTTQVSYYINRIHPTTSKVTNGDVEIVELNDVTQGKPRFFVSVKERSNWMGMRPADCYFIKHKRDFRLDPRIEVKDNNKVIVRMRQSCDPETPTQFLAKSFTVFFSEDEDCKKKVSKEISIPNAIFKATFLEVDRLSNFLCVVAFRDNETSSWVSHRPFDSISTYSWLQLTTTVYLPIGLFIMVFIVISFTVFYKCKSRREYFQTLNVTSQDSFHRFPFLNTDQQSS